LLLILGLPRRPRLVESPEPLALFIGQQPGESGPRAIERLPFYSHTADAVFHVPADGARQDHFFEVAAFLDEIVDGVAVRSG
jgi:hypothetical protein